MVNELKKQLKKDSAWIIQVNDKYIKGLGFLDVEYTNNINEAKTFKSKLGTSMKRFLNECNCVEDLESQKITLVNIGLIKRFM